jgi:hypothetical protein
MLTITNVIIFNWIFGCCISWHIYSKRRYEQRIKNIIAQRKEFANDVEFIRYVNRMDLTLMEYFDIARAFLNEKAEEFEEATKSIKEIPEQGPKDPRTICH